MLNLNRKTLFIVFLTVMVSVPCALKRQLKEYLKIEVQQSSTSGTNKAPCKTVCSFDQQIKSEKEDRLTPPAKEYVSFSDVAKTAFNAGASQHDSFKEKIPTYLKNREFLI